MIIFYLNQFKIEAFDRTADFSLNPLSNNGNWFLTSSVNTMNTAQSPMFNYTVHSVNTPCGIQSPYWTQPVFNNAVQTHRVGSSESMAHFGFNHEYWANLANFQLTLWKKRKNFYPSRIFCRKLSNVFHLAKNLEKDSLKVVSVQTTNVRKQQIVQLRLHNQYQWANQICGHEEDATLFIQ